MVPDQANRLRRALVTGGSRGIGRAIALRLAADGFDVGIAYLTNTKAAEEVAAEIRAQNRIALTLEGDIADPLSAQKIVAEAAERLDGLDLFVANAGNLVFKPFLETSIEEFDRQFNVNSRGTYFAIQAAAKIMASQHGGGRIIMVTSDAAVRTYPGLSVYSMTKAALKNLTELLAKELAPFGITVNAVAPGTTETDMNRAALADPDKRSMLLSSIQLGRPGQPNDVAGAISFLASPDAAFVTGASLAVDGGAAIH